MTDRTFNERLHARGRQIHERIRAVINDLDDAQLTWRPTPTAHSIAFALWHIARTEDNFQRDVNGGDMVWIQGGYGAKWGYPERGVGTSWDDEKAASLPHPGKQKLMDYVDAVFDAADRAIDSLDERKLEEVRRSGFLGKDDLLGEVLLGAMTHSSRHLGEIEYIKGLLGLKGTATY